MNPLSPADLIHLQSAQDHLQQSRPPDAGLELDQISPDQRAHPDVLEARWEVSAQAGNWEATLEISRLLRQVAPESQNGWTYLACSLAELKRTPEAYETLSAAFEKFPQVPMIAYNLACFACKMDRLKDASRWLARAIEIGGRAEVKLMALDDADLAPLLDEILRFVKRMDLAARLAALETRIEAACHRARRPRTSVTLLAVSKGQTPALIKAAADLGLTRFGENRVQEAKVKIGQCPGQLRWQMIGHLQSNKARDAVHFFEMIQSVDSLALAQEINKWADKAAKTMPILLEVNVAGEASKYGYKPAQLLEDLTAINDLRKIEIHGLMTIAPWTPEPEKVRPVFRELHELKERCDGILGAPLPHLSMGMSGDFEVAIEEGATIIRLGTALFGPRSP